MYLEHLSLTNFRNYARLELDLAPGLTVFTGTNAQGKSNLLEAIYFLATTKSFRGVGDRELIDWWAAESGLNWARVDAIVRRERGLLRVEVVVQDDKDDGAQTVGPRGKGGTTKRVRLNQIPKRAIDLIGQVNVVMFAPQDLDLILGPPPVRRRYLDITVSQVDPRYCRSLAHYNRVLLQRNNLLRQIRDGKARPDQLSFWDREMARSGAYIISRRLDTVQDLDGKAQHLHHRLTGNAETLSIKYVSSLLAAERGVEVPATQQTALEEEFLHQLSEVQSREMLQGSSLLGPHRDDVAFLLDGRAASSFASRGQQRTITISLKLGEADFMAEQAGEQPILLLDDVMSELDDARREDLRGAIIGQRQALVTTTDLSLFGSELLHDAAIYRVEQGTLQRIARGQESDSVA